MDALSSRSHPAVAALLLSVPFIIVLVFAGSRMGDEAGHAGSHLALALPILLLLASSTRWRKPAAGRMGSVGRKLVLIALAIVGAAQTLEALGAFGFEGYARQYDPLATLHDTSMFAGPPGLLLLLIGGILTAVARVNERAEGSGRIAVVVMAATVFAALLLKFTVLGA